jgi:hypothetical protein
MSEPAANICVAKECRKVWQVTRLVVIPAAKVATRKNFRTPIGCKWYLQISPVRGWMQYLGEGNRNAHVGRLYTSGYFLCRAGLIAAEIPSSASFSWIAMAFRYRAPSRTIDDNPSQVFTCLFVLSHYGLRETYDQYRCLAVVCLSFLLLLNRSRRAIR